MNTEVEQSAEKNQWLSKEFIGIIVVLILAIASIGYSWSLDQRLVVLQEGLDDAMSEMMSEIKNRDDRIAQLHDCVQGLQLSQSVSGNVVTDDLYIDRALLITENGKISGRIDVLPQPAFILNYEGQGRFNVSDRELNASLLQLIRAFEDSIRSFGSFGSIDEIEISIQNYDIATYSQRKITLVGE